MRSALYRFMHEPELEHELEHEHEFEPELEPELGKRESTTTASSTLYS